MRDWIEINGRRLIWEDFIGILDYYRYKSIIRGKGRDVRNQYNYMIYVLQELAYDYHEGSDYVLDHLEDFITRHYMKMPVERRLPEALEELFNQMQTRLHINLSEVLDECVKNSLKTYQHMQDTEKAESADSFPAGEAWRHRQQGSDQKGVLSDEPAESENEMPGVPGGEAGDSGHQYLVRAPDTGHFLRYDYQRTAEAGRGG